MDAKGALGFELLDEAEPADGARLAFCELTEALAERKEFSIDTLARMGAAWSSAEWTSLSKALGSTELFAESNS